MVVNRVEVRELKVIGVACLGTEPSRELISKAREFVRELARLCGSGVYLALGGYWGLMKVVVEEALANDVQVVLFPPIEREYEQFPGKVLVIRTGMGYRLRSVVFVRSVDVLTILGGEAGTFQEAVTAYLEGKPVLVLGNTGLMTDKLAGFTPYLDTRELAEVKIISEPSVLAREACRLVSN